VLFPSKRWTVRRKNCETYSESFHTTLLIGRLSVFHLKYHAERFVFRLSVLLLFIFNMNYCELECNSKLLLSQKLAKYLHGEQKNRENWKKNN
jgi:hypothetical protein